jgi:hypothetical protein
MRIRGGIEEMNACEVKSVDLVQSLGGQET